MEFQQVTEVLRSSISPVALISGIGLLLLSMTTRFGRAIDRARELARIARAGEDPAPPELARQVRVFYRRCRRLRLSIWMASASIFALSLIIFALFAIALFDLALAELVVALFLLGVALLVGSVALFLRDLRESLEALRIEVRSFLDTGGDPSRGD